MKEQSILIESTCGQHGYRRHKTKLVMASNQDSTLFSDGDLQNAMPLSHITFGESIGWL